MEAVTLKISVIIPFRNAMKELPTVVGAMKRQTCSPHFEVVWIDDGSVDGGGTWLRTQLSAGWRVAVHPTTRGSYAARNTGLRLAVSDKLAFTDVDCRPHDDWLERGLAALAAAPRVAGRIQLEISQSSHIAELVDAGRFLRQDRYVNEGFGATANLFVDRAVFGIVGEFDEQLRSGGDHEFGWRCSQAGIPITYAEDATVSHPARASLGQLLRKGERVGYGVGQIVRRGGMPISTVVRRAFERFALAGRAAERKRCPTVVVDRKQRLLVTAVHLLVIVATSFGCLMGIARNGTNVAPPEHRPHRKDSI